MWITPKGPHTRYLAIWVNGVNIMANGASTVEFFEKGKASLGQYLMYNPPIIGDYVSWDEAKYEVVERNCDIKDNRVRITVERCDDA